MCILSTVCSCFFMPVHSVFRPGNHTPMAAIRIHRRCDARIYVLASWRLSQVSPLWRVMARTILLLMSVVVIAVCDTAVSSSSAESQSSCPALVPAFCPNDQCGSSQGIGKAEPSTIRTDGETGEWLLKQNRRPEFQLAIISINNVTRHYIIWSLIVLSLYWKYCGSEVARFIISHQW